MDTQHEFQRRSLIKTCPRKLEKQRKTKKNFLLPLCVCVLCLALFALQATPLLVTVIGIKKGVFNEMIEEVYGELVVRARSGAEVDAMGRLLEVACTPPTPADGRHVRKRWEKGHYHA